MEHAVVADGNPAAHNCSVNWRNASSRLKTPNGALVCELCLLVKVGTGMGDVVRAGRRPRRRRDCVTWLETEACVRDDDDDAIGFSTKKADTNKPNKHQTEVTKKKKRKIK
jgi:hypothetical protein